MKRKISVTTGSRAEYGILRPVLKKIKDSRTLDLCLIVTGMHLSKKYGMTINEIKKDGFKIAATVNMVPKNDSSYSMTKSLGKGIIKFSYIFQKLRPDINLVLGDRDEMLASALAAYHMNIPNAHVHGGETSGGIDEYTRHAITKISNIHFAATKKSMERIIRLGENPQYVFLTGSPSIDEVLSNRITGKKILEKRYNIKISGKEILLLQHPVTTQIEDTEKQITILLNAITKNKKTTIAIAPNSDAGHKKIFEKIKECSRKYDFVKVYPSIPRSDYLGMLRNFGVLVGNSSSGLIEASYFDIPVINIGIRQKNRERGNNVIDVKGNSVNLIHKAILAALRKPHKTDSVNRFIYGDGTSSNKIVKHLTEIVLNKNLIQKQIFY